MDRMLLVVFDSENKACEGKKALSQLENEGSRLAASAEVAYGTERQLPRNQWRMPQFSST